jgi:hypothetical protein
MPWFTKEFNPEMFQENPKFFNVGSSKIVKIVTSPYWANANAHKHSSKATNKNG